MRQQKNKSYGAFGRTTSPLKATPKNPISFTHRPILGNINKGTTTIKNWEYFNGILIQISFRTSEEIEILGSGVLIAPGVAFCATHVIFPHLENIANGKVTPICFGITKDGLQIWEIKATTCCENSDISILALEFCSKPPRNNLFSLSQISTRTPAIGEELTICGFKASKDKFRNRENGAFTEGAVWISKGHVIEVFPNGRDRIMLPWPCLAIDVSSTGGMSGGPVYDKNGSLVGILCSSIEDDENGISYASLIWPSLTYKFRMHWPLNTPTEELTLLDIAHGGCKIDKPEAFIQIDDETGRKIYYEIWS